MKSLRCVTPILCKIENSSLTDRPESLSTFLEFIAKENFIFQAACVPGTFSESWTTGASAPFILVRSPDLSQCWRRVYLIIVCIEPCCAYTLHRATWELPSEDKSDLETQVPSITHIKENKKQSWKIFSRTIHLRESVVAL